MKIPSADLFELTKSLSKHEKRFILLELKESKQNINYKLYLTISKQKKYNEKKLKLDIHEQKIINNLPFHKNNLYNKILSLLRKYQLKSSEKLKLTEEVEYLNILKGKRLYKKLGKEIKRLEKICKEQENFDLLLIILRCKSQFIIETTDSNLIRNIEENSTQEKYCLERIKTSQALNTIDKLLFINNKISFDKDTKLEDVLKKHHFQSITPVTFNELYQFNCIQSQIAWTTGKMEDYYKWRKESFLLWNKNPEKAKQKTFTFTSVLVNYLDSCRVVRNEEEFFLVLKQLRSVKNNQKDVQQRIFFFSYNLELLWYIHQQNFNKGISKYRHIKRNIDKYEINTTNQISLLSNTAICHLQMGKFKSALNILQQMIKINPGDMRKDLKVIKNILLLLCYFKSPNKIDEFENQCEKTQFLMDSHQLENGECFTEIISKLFSSVDKKDKEKHKNKLLKYAKNNSSIFGYFDFELWINNWIKN